MSASDSGPLAQVTAADVLRWGRAQPADEVIGVCESEGACLIAQYASDVLDRYLYVYPSGVNNPSNGRYLDDDMNEHVLPDDLDALAQAFDALKVEDFTLWPDDVSTRYEMHPADLDRLEATP